MDTYTLFVDESGDFETQRGEWVVGGVLFNSNSEDVLKKLDSALSPLVNEFDVADKTEFHLTEFRKDVGDKEAINRAELLFSAIRKTNLTFHLLCVINENKDSLSTPERTYRAMLTDLLAMLDSVIPNLHETKQLELVVATRTINGVRTTTFRDIVTDIVGSLPKYFEYDLISSGFVHLLQKNRIVVTQDVAVRNWGLICADFISNITYHRHKEAENSLLDKLSSKNLYFSFMAFGNHKERRARIAERNGDVVLAASRWLQILAEAKEDKSDEIREEVTKLLKKLHYRSFGSTEYELGLATIVDRVWRQGSGTEKTLLSLRVLKQSILEHGDIEKDMSAVLEVFHIRNLTLMLFNQMADVDTAKKIANSQSETVRKLLALPEFLGHYLHFKRLSSEILINDLDFQGALRVADQYNNLVENFFQLMPAVNTDIVDEEIAERSDLWLRKESFVLRIILLANDLKDPKQAEEVNQRLVKLNKMAPENLLSRAACLMLHYLLKIGQPARAMDYLLENIDDRMVGPYMIFWALMTRNEYVTAYSQDGKVETLTNFLNLRLADLEPNDTNLPHFLIWREFSRWKWIADKDSGEAGKYIRRARKTLKLMPSNLTNLFANMNDFYCSCVGQSPEKYLSTKDRFIC